MPNRAFDWLKQAIKDLDHAKLSMESNDREWALASLMEHHLSTMDHYRVRRL